MLNYILERVFSNVQECFYHNIRLKKMYTIKLYSYQSLKPMKQINKNEAQAKVGENDQITSLGCLTAVKMGGILFSSIFVF